MSQSTTKKPPQQERSRQTLRKILKATERLLANRTLEQITVRQILKEAQVSTGSFYARFSGKEALIQAIWDEMKLTVDDFLDKLEDSGPKSLAARVHLLISHRIERYYKYRGLFSAFSARAREGKPPFSRQDRKEYMRSQRDLMAFLMEAREEITHPQPEQAIILAEFATAAAARQLIWFPADPHASTIKRTKRQLIEELSDLFLAYLTKQDSTR